MGCVEEGRNGSGGGARWCFGEGGLMGVIEMNL